MLQKITDFLIYSVVLFLPLYLVRFSVFQIPTNLVEILIGMAFFIWLFQFKKTSPIFNLPQIYKLSFLLIFLGITLSAFLNPHWNTEAGIIKGWFLFPFLFFLIIIDRINYHEKRNQILKFFFVSSASVGLVSFFYLLAGQLTFDGRLQAFYLSPNYLALFLTPGIIIGFFSVIQTILSGKKNTLPFYFLCFSLLIMLIDLYFTFSYGAWLALFLGLLLAFGLTDLISRSQKIKNFWGGIILISLVFSLQLSSQKMDDLIRFSPRSSFASRMMIWESAWKIGRDNPIWGIGPGNFQEKYLEYQEYFPFYLEWAVPQPHNLYLAFWLQSGLLGLLGFLLLVGTWTIQMLRVLKNKKNGFMETALLAIVFSILIHGLFDTPYWKNDLSLLFWIILALGLTFLTSTNQDDTNDR